VSGRDPALRAVVIDYPPYGPYEAERAACATAGWHLDVLPFAELAARRPAADVLLNVSGDRLDPDLLDATGCRAAVGYGVGLDWIDLGEAAARDLTVANMPVANVPDVALHALALILACERRLAHLDRVVRSGGFDAGPHQGIRRPELRTLGLVAFGNIPRRLAAFAAPLGYRLQAHDPGVDDATIRAAGVEPVANLDDLLATSDIVSIHAPGTAATHHLLDRRRIGLLPRGASIVVTSRGSVYDPRALADALADGHVAAAGIDVFEPEPPGSGHPLLAAPNTIVTPHVAGLSADAIAELHATAAAVIVALAAGADPPGLVLRGKALASSRGR
jgi:D-3-phosphoglycerate dehydrogenase